MGSLYVFFETLQATTAIITAIATTSRLDKGPTVNDFRKNIVLAPFLSLVHFCSHLA